MLVVCVFASALGGLIMCLLVLRDVFWPATDHAPRTDLDLQITKGGHVIAAACFAMTAMLAIILVARTPLRAAQPQVAVSVPDPHVAERLAALDRDRAALAEQVSALGTTMQTLREQVTATDGGVQGMRTRLDQTDSRMAKAESSLTSAEAGLKRLSEEITQANARARQAERSAPTKPIVVGPREMVVPAAPPAPPVPPPPPPQRRTELERPHESTSPSLPPTAAAAPPVTQTPAPAPPSPPTAAAAAPKPAPTPPPAAKAATAKPAPSAAASAPRDAPPTNLTDKIKNDWSTIRRGFESAGDDFSNAMRDFGRRATGRE